MSNTLREVPSTILAKWAAADFSSVPTSDPGSNQPWLTPDGRLAVGAYQPVLTRAASPVAANTVLGSDGLGGSVAAPITWTDLILLTDRMLSGTKLLVDGGGFGSRLLPVSDGIAVQNYAETGRGTVDANAYFACRINGAKSGVFEAPSWDHSYLAIQHASLARSPSNAALAQASNGLTIINSAPGQSLVLRAGGVTAYTIDVSRNHNFHSGNLTGTHIQNVGTGDNPTFALPSCGTYTVATLPSASANAGREAQVTDSSVTTNGSTVAGGGSNRTKLYSNGTNWKVVAA